MDRGGGSKKSRSRSGTPRGLPARIAVLPATERGVRIARMIEAGPFGEVRVFPPGGDGGLSWSVKEAAAKYDGLVFISAVGIAVRLTGPLLKSKEKDPAVVVVDERATFSISLLSGHLGGANRLARAIADLTGATPVVTTATDIWGLPSAEDLAEELSLAVEDASRIKAVNSAILDSALAKGDGRAGVVIVDGSAKRRASMRRFLGGFKKAKDVFAFSSVLKARPGARAYVFVTDEAYPAVPDGLAAQTLVLRPRDVVLGIGCRRGASSGEIREAVDGVLSRAGVSPLSVRKIATIDAKRDEKGLLAYARGVGLPIEFHSADKLNSRRPPSGVSRKALEALGARSVAEAAALVSSGARRIWIRKQKTEKVTVAAARAPFTS